MKNHTSPPFLPTVMKLAGLQSQFQSLHFQPKIYGKKRTFMKHLDIFCLAPKLQPIYKHSAVFWPINISLQWAALPTNSSLGSKSPCKARGILEKIMRNKSRRCPVRAQNWGDHSPELSEGAFSSKFSSPPTTSFFSGLKNNSEVELKEFRKECEQQTLQFQLVVGSSLRKTSNPTSGISRIYRNLWIFGRFKSHCPVTVITSEITIIPWKMTQNASAH